MINGFDEVKERLVELDGCAFTCSLVYKYCDVFTHDLYSKFVEQVLDINSISLMAYRGELLDKDEVLLRRYLVLAFFEQELESLK